MEFYSAQTFLCASSTALLWALTHSLTRSQTRASLVPRRRTKFVVTQHADCLLSQNRNLHPETSLTLVSLSMLLLGMSIGSFGPCRTVLQYVGG